MKNLFLVTLISYSLSTFGHGGVDHSIPTVKEVKDNKKDVTEIYTKINNSYVAGPREIVKNSCFDCHSSETHYPWYYKLPMVKSIIDDDVKEARKHLDFTEDFPFKSHETPLNDLKSIKKAVSSGSMPPSNYRFLHWKSGLNENEKKQLIKWVDDSIKLLNKSSK